MRPLLPLVLLGLASASCTVATDESIFVEGVVPPEVSATDGCSFKAVQSNPVFSTGGIYDIGGASRGYFAALQVRTNLPSTFSTTDVSSSRTQSPNYPNYGPVDNNVVIFENAKISYEVLTDEETGKALQAAASTLNPPQNLKCVKGVCAIEEVTVTAGGTVFNQQTSLNTASIASTELVSFSLATNLKQIAERAGVLSAPADRLKMIATVSIVGSTTGNGEIRKVTSFPLPFPIDLCIGCIAANEDICDNFDAIVVANPNAADEVCIAGQDRPFQVCACIERNNAGEPTTTPPTVTKAVTTADSCNEEEDE